jgi:hypothetical protein
MNELILALAMMGIGDQVQEALRPQPTKEQYDLIEKLGNREWKVRDEADKELRKMGYDALVAIKKKGFTSECPEIHYRAERIHASYFRVTGTNREVGEVTGLFKLGEVKLGDGRIVKIPAGTAQKYLLRYIKAEFGGSDEDNLTDQIFYTYDNDEFKWLLREATVMFAKDLYKKGYRREDVIQIMDAIQANQEKWKAFDLRYKEDDTEYSGQHNG